MTTTHPRFVSYIDKSREYYQAQGYEAPYRWATEATVPFAPLPGPLKSLRLGLITTADRAPRSEGREGMLYAQPVASRGAFHTEMFWDRDATHTDDPETILPFAAAEAAVDEGMLGSVSPRFYGVPTEYSQRRTREEDAPAILSWLQEDQVDIAFLAAL